MTRYLQLPACILAGLLCHAAVGPAGAQQASAISDLPPGQADNTDRFDTDPIDSLRGSRSVLDDPADEFVRREPEPQDAERVRRRQRRADRNALRGIPDSDIPTVGGIPQAIPEEPFDLVPDLPTLSSYQPADYSHH